MAAARLSPISRLASTSGRVSAAHLINAARYPINKGGEEYLELVHSGRKSLRREGILVMPELLNPSAISRFLQEEEELFRTGESSHVRYSHTTEFNTDLRNESAATKPRSMTQDADQHVIGYHQLREHSLLRALYHWQPLLHFVQDVMQRPLFLSADPMNCLHLNRYLEGNELGWHHDKSEFFFNLVLQQPMAGGTFEYVHASKGREEVVQRTIAGDASEVIRPTLEPGSAVIFQGSENLHRVTPIIGQVPRVTAIFNYASEEGGGMLEADVRDLFFGKRSGTWNGASAEDMRRKNYQVGASLDFVKDYRELAALPAWDDVLAGRGAEVRVLDVCCGTGRWAQAFSEQLLTRKDVKVAASFTDVCEASLEVLRKRLPVLAGFSVDHVVQANIGAEQDKQRLPNDAFDVITNMHGLYGLPKAVLPAAIEFMASKLNSDGQLIVALGSEDSLYQRIPAALHDLGMLGKRYTSVFEVLAACKELGLEVSADSLVYHEEYSAQDRAGLERFVMEECVGNTFSVEDAPKFTTDNVFKALEPLLSSYYHEASDSFRFRQDVSVLRIRRTVLPDMLSDHQRYAAAYELRKSASTMQSNTLSFLRAHGRELVPGAGADSLSIMSVGMGEGELDFALMHSLLADKHSAPQSIRFTGIEPSHDMVSRFNRALGEQPWAGDGDVQVDVHHGAFDADAVVANEGAHDVVFLGHCMYYFEDTAETVRMAMRCLRPGGRLVIVHQGATGVPELQHVLMPKLRGAVTDSLTAAEIEDVLRGQLQGDIGDYKRHDIAAHLDLSEVAAGSATGRSVASFCLETELQAASKDQWSMVQREFQARSCPGPAPGHSSAGPFLYEPVHCFVVQQQVAA